MKQLTLMAVMSVLFTVLSSSQAQAFTFTESGDAGELLNTAQVITSDISSERMPLESISGTISGDADLFQIFLTDSQTFSATTVGGASFDTQLFLFDSEGMGIYGNDNATPKLNQSTLPTGGFSPTASGIYYLAISGFDYDPVSATGKIFADFPEVSFDQVVGSTGPGGKLPLSSFDGARLDSGGSYTIALTGAETVPQAVPESSSMLATLALGVWGLGAVLKHQKNK